ncbi:MAG: ribonuclease III domain-containing protein, partial [Dehalococcoidia bacterium]|nr:ribonuclease III domain-containing protein [Dehalococcoidia bacterium]
MNTKAGSRHEAAVEQRLSISFADRDLLSLALTHPSAVNEDPSSFSSSNQRLEFLGDAYIDFVVAWELYSRLTQMTEGELTELRSAIVRGKTLARVARSLSLGSCLYMGQGEERGGGRERESNLTAALEALVGDKTLAELAAQHDVHPNMITQWKRQAKQSLPEVFAKKNARGV